MEKEEFIKLLKYEVEKYLKGKKLNESAWNKTLEIFEESYSEMIFRVASKETTWDRCVNDMLYVYHML